MCRIKLQKPIVRQPSFEEYSIDKEQLRSKLDALEGLKRIYLWDKHYYYVSHEDWGKIFSDVLLNLPKYTKEKFDCDNFAFLVAARIAEKYQINCCGIVMGSHRNGHAFNIFLSDAGLFYLEPQNGSVFSIGEDSGYKANFVFFG